MAKLKSVQLPWRRTKTGMVAEFGTVFRIELKDAGWQCSVGAGQRRQVIEEGLRTKSAGRKVAEAHAAKLPEVMEALANQDVSGSARGPRRMPSGRGRGRATSAAAQVRESQSPERPGEVEETRMPADAPSADSPKSPQGPTADGGPALISLTRVSDGSLFGRVAGACWIANRREVLFSAPVAPEEQQRVREAVADHYRGEREAKRAALKAARTARRTPSAAKAAPSAATEKVAEKKVTKARGRKKKAAKAATRAGKEGEAMTTTKAAKGPTATKDAAPAKTTTAAGKPKGKRPANKAEGEPVTTAPRGRGRAKSEAPVTKVQPGAKASVAAPAITWSEAQGLRGVAAHGTFVIEAEGQRHGLYFYDPSGQSRHLRSGEVAELRKVAEEMAARGLPAPERETLSASQTETLLRMFAGTAGGAPA